jgi:peptidoglycan/LPS O-acetylase OafA/YrhL
MEQKPAITASIDTPEHNSYLRPLRYMPQLDGLRAIAIGLVLTGHFYSQAASLSVPLAWLGVRLFFVLSGFLITSILLLQKEKIAANVLSRSVALKTFYMRRVLRLFPLYYLVIALALFFNVDMGRESWAYLVLYLTNVKMALIGGWIGEFSHLWSLAAEEQFYLLWPWLIIFLKNRSLPWVLTAVVLSGLVFRALMVYTGQSIFADMLLFGVTDALGMGALLAVMSNIRIDSRIMNKVKYLFFRALPIAALLGLIASVILFVTVEWTSATFGIWATFLTSLPFAWLVWHSSSGFEGLLGRFLSSGPMVYIGKISYGIYIIHAFVPSLLSRININPGNLPKGVEAWFLVITLATILLASVSWFLLERPANRLKSKFKY